MDLLPMYGVDPAEFAETGPRSLGVVGSREFPDVELLAAFVRALDPSIEVVSGGARGVDRVAISVARSLGRPWRVFAPDIRDHDDRVHVVRALLARNVRIVEHSAEVVAFWDGASTGTLHAVASAVERQRRARVYLARPLRDRMSGVVPSPAAWLALEREAEDLALELADRYLEERRSRRPRRPSMAHG